MKALLLLFVTFKVGASAQVGLPLGRPDVNGKSIVTSHDFGTYLQSGVVTLPKFGSAGPCQYEMTNTRDGFALTVTQGRERMTVRLRPQDNLKFNIAYNSTDWSAVTRTTVPATSNPPHSLNFQYMEKHRTFFTRARPEVALSVADTRPGGWQNPRAIVCGF